MPYDRFLDFVPVWAFFILITIITLLPTEVGQRMGARRRRLATAEPEGPVGNVVGATLALLGFMVALTLGAATARFEERKEALIDGVNAIETAFRNAALIPEPHKGEVRKMLREYVEIRLAMPDFYSEPYQLAGLDVRARELQSLIWSRAEALASQDRSSEVYALFASSLNDVFQMYNKRVILGAVHRIPFMVWVVLVVVTIISTFGVGFQFGLVGNRSMIANIALALTFALVLAIIFDIDQPGKGLIQVDQQPMRDLFDRLKP